MNTIRSFVLTLTLATFTLVPLGAMVEGFDVVERNSELYTQMLALVKAHKNFPVFFVKNLEELLKSKDEFNDMDVCVAVLKKCLETEGTSLDQMKDVSFLATPLHWAVYNRYNNLVELFLKVAGDQAYALACMQNSEGKTALHWAAKMAIKGDAEQVVVRALLDTAPNQKAVDALIDIHSNDGMNIWYYVGYDKPEVESIIFKYKSSARWCVLF